MAPHWNRIPEEFENKLNKLIQKQIQHEKEYVEQHTEMKGPYLLDSPTYRFIHQLKKLHFNAYQGKRMSKKCSKK
jgi:hypothetical protein